jgi:formylglycine-generating enzyme required for sulfatase activity
MAHQVFISYASADRENADRVCEALEQAGFPCWIAPRNIPAGNDFPGAIVDAIAAARVLVLLVTEHSATSPHVLTEVGHAFNGRKRIVPFRLSTAALPADLGYFLSMTQWLDAPEGCTEANLGKLTEAVRDALAGKPWEATVTGTGRRRKMLVALLAVPVLAAGGVAVWKWPRPAKPVESPPLPQPVTPAAPKPQTWVNPADGLTYVRIPAGLFTMGCSPGDSDCDDNEKPAHPVRIDRDFWMGQTEVTLAAYRAYAAKHGLKAPQGDDKLPVTRVDWAGARKFCTDAGGRLPFEAEWEYAARAGATGAYYGVLDEIAWYAGNSDGAPHPVQQKAPNAFGLYDMLGNVAELVIDRYYKKYYLDSPATGPGVDLPLPSNATATARGGFWDSPPANVRLSCRAERQPDDASPITGFRCVVDRP